MHQCCDAAAIRIWWHLYSGGIGNQTQHSNSASAWGDERGLGVGQRGRLLEVRRRGGQEGTPCVWRLQTLTSPHYFTIVNNSGGRTNIMAIICEGVSSFGSWKWNCGFIFFVSFSFSFPPSLPLLPSLSSFPHGILSWIPTHGNLQKNTIALSYSESAFPHLPEQLRRVNLSQKWFCSLNKERC